MFAGCRIGVEPVHLLAGGDTLADCLGKHTVLVDLNRREYVELFPLLAERRVDP